MPVQVASVLWRAVILNQPIRVALGSIIAVASLQCDRKRSVASRLATSKPPTTSKRATASQPATTSQASGIMDSVTKDSMIRSATDYLLQEGRLPAEYDVEAARTS